MVVAIGGTMFQNMPARYLEDKHLPTDIATTPETYAATLRSMPANDEKTILIVEAFSQSFQTLAQILAGTGGIGWILSFAAP
jgi:hypothetical protein